MPLEEFAPPGDITWTRMGYSRDMIDTNFGDSVFPPKWRSSMTVYYYIVPDEETVDAYPDSRIIYLKLSCSITGYNPNEDLLYARKIAEEQDRLDDLQKSIWEVISSKGWAQKYWPCLGAIIQLAVYPNNSEGVSPDDYPYIMDFEPKKRELFEAVKEGSEVLESSSEKVSTLKGSTTTKKADVSAKGSFLGIGADTSYGVQSTLIDNRNTDTGKEARETESRSTSISQMYQLFNGYHLGMNRALFVVNPRPHTVSSDSAEETRYSLINGERKLEGIQEMFLVINLPRSHDGFCIQAGLDTAHKVTSSASAWMSRKMNHNQVPFYDGDFYNASQTQPTPAPAQAVDHLIITRRIIQGCGVFDENGNLKIRQIPGDIKPPIVTGEFMTPVETQSRAMYRLADSLRKHVELAGTIAHELNIRQARIAEHLMDSVTAGNYKPRSITETVAFKSLAGTAIDNLDITIDQLVKLQYINQQTGGKLQKSRIYTVGDLFRESSDRITDVDIDSIRNKIIK